MQKGGRSTVTFRLRVKLHKINAFYSSYERKERFNVKDSEVNQAHC